MTGCPACTIRRRASSRPRMDASRPTTIRTSSVSSLVSPYPRTQRLYKLLGEPKKFTPAEMLAIQTDVVSPFDRFCAERFVYSIDHSPKASKRVKEAAEIMRNWDGTMGVDSTAATIAYYSREKLKEMLLRAKLGEDWQEYRWFLEPVWLEDVLTHQPERWLPGGFGSYDQLLTSAVEAAVSDPAVPHVLSMWKWGRVHRIDLKHPFWSHFPILKKGAGTEACRGQGTRTRSSRWRKSLRHRSG